MMQFFNNFFKKRSFVRWEKSIDVGEMNWRVG